MEQVSRPLSVVVGLDMEEATLSDTGRPEDDEPCSMKGTPPERERERETERERERQRETERGRDREREIQTDRQSERVRDRERHGQRGRGEVSYLQHASGSIMRTF